MPRTTQGKGDGCIRLPCFLLQLYIYPERQRRPRLMGAPVEKRASRAAAAALLHKKGYMMVWALLVSLLSSLSLLACVLLLMESI